MAYEFFKFLSKSIFGILAGAIGLSYLLVPYEKLKEKMPSIKSPKTMKICGVILVVLGAIMIVMAAGNYILF